MFVEEINKMNQGYIKKVEEVYGGPGKDEIAIPDNGSPANDVMLALAEKGKSADFMKSLQEQHPKLFKNKGEN